MSRRCLEVVLFRGCLKQILFVTLEDVLIKSFRRRLEDVIRCCKEDLFETSPIRLKMTSRNLYWSSKDYGNTNKKVIREFKDEQSSKIK